MKVTVRVPASTSNLGPGYDSLGMALSLQAKFTFEPSDELVIEGFGRPRDSLSLIHISEPTRLS